MAGIYIHIPFCKQTCHYCNFHFSTSLQFKTKLVDCIVKEINIRKDFFNTSTNKDITIETIYFGGGTPSILKKEEIDRILISVNQHFTLSEDVEISLEANPENLTTPYLKGLKEIGVNRLSIGTQSFDDALLKYMNRAHNSKEALVAIEKSLSAGFESLNIDMIYNIPGLTTKQWITSLEQLSNLAINHISCYALTVEPKTALHHFINKKKMLAPDERLMAEQFLITSEVLEKKGFEHYEISNYALKGQYSKHNTAYWQKQAYLGLGPSAHSYSPHKRSWNIANNAKYIKAIVSEELPIEHEILSKKDQFNEYLMTGLRTTWGISISTIEKEFNSQFSNHIKNCLKTLNNTYFDLTNNDIIKLTKKGWLWSDHLIGQLFYD